MVFAGVFQWASVFFLMRRAARTDGTQTTIVSALRAFGASVSITSAVGQGFCDIVVGYGGRNFLIEIKDPTKPKADRQLTPDQVKFRDAWQGQYAVVETVEQAISILKESQMKYESAISRLEVARENCERNEAIHRAENNDGQAKLDRALSSSYIVAIALLKST